MCGIVGIICKVPQKFSKNLFYATNQMKHRGPDDEGYVLFQNNKPKVFYGDDTAIKNNKLKHIKSSFNDYYNIGLGHRRLSILDLSPNGHQPMCDETGRYWIVYNGEVYNFREIRKELSSYGYSFVSDSDTEVILKSYIRWGEKCLQKFNGMFAFAIYDSKENLLFLARDRIGIKPLYYYLKDNVFIFASDIKTLIKSKLCTPEVDMEGIYHNFSFSMTPRPNTSFKGIFSLKQSHYMIFNTKTLDFKVIEYWDIPTNIQKKNMKEFEAIELLEEELKKSIKYRLISDVEVGTFMSGGIDSTTISAIASIIHPNIKAFTLGFDKSISKYDEIQEAKATASLYNMQHIISVLKADVVLENIDNMILRYEEPFHHLAANFAISKIVAKNGVKVILNGLGGDELFAGYSLYKKLNQWKLLSNFSSFSFLLPNIGKLKKLKEISAIKDVYQYYAYSYSNYTDYDKKYLFPKNYIFDSLNEIKNKYYKKGKIFSDDIELLSYLDIKSYIGNHHVHRVDQFTMHFSIEGRFPFLDHNLIEKVFTIPTKYKINNGVQKYVLRKVAQKYIAPECLVMKKKGFGLPLEYWFENELKELTKAAIISLKKRDIFKAESIDYIMRFGSITQKWHLVMFELWYKKFIEEGLRNE